MTTFVRQRVAVIHSQQPWNQYAGGGIGQPDSEQAWMRKLAEILAYKLTKAGHIAYLSPQGSSYADNVRWVNAGQFDQVISCHSNATGREGDQPKGAGVYYVSDGGKRMAVPIAARLGKIVPGGSYLSTSLSVAELTQTNPPAILIEHHFHDWAGGADWIRANLDAMAQADCDGFCDAFGRLAETPPPIVSPGQNPAILPTLARVATFNCDGWGKTSMTGKQIDALMGVLLTLSASIYCLTECPEWLRDHFRGLCKCPADAHRRLTGGASRWLVRVRGSQVILRDSTKWASGPYDSDKFGPTDYHGWLWETLTQPTTKARLTVGCYHLPPNVVASQAFQRDGVQGFLAEMPSGARLVGGDGADDTAWFSGWADARTAAKASASRTAPTYGKTIRDRIHVKGIVVRRYTVIPSNGASDHNPVLAQITIPAGADPSL